MKEINAITQDILNAAFKLHTMYGPGLYESAYELLMQIELQRSGHKVERQKPVSIEHESVVVDNAFRLDLLIDGLVVVELKSCEQQVPVFAKQLKTYLVLRQTRRPSDQLRSDFAEERHRARRKSL